MIAWDENDGCWALGVAVVGVRECNVDRHVKHSIDNINPQTVNTTLFEHSINDMIFYPFRCIQFSPDVFRIFLFPIIIIRFFISVFIFPSFFFTPCSLYIVLLLFCCALHLAEREQNRVETKNYISHSDIDTKGMWICCQHQ